ncbi:hypothetical protein QFC22_000706 [Naganishia vaughanmartiniae]|uniref:Uncharacterized protein n=1 Tax=Naganishia vaughanmartiniae TaxID=1424756 RepID=A0ACC2XKL6_9TREE|nr:hypothetical protein QFC22_000706 [Naganishia vaughanmartiniae]
MSRSSSISSTSGFVTPQGSILSLPLQDGDDIQNSQGIPYVRSADQDSLNLKDSVNLEAGFVRDDSDFTDTEVTADAKYTQKSSSKSTPEHFLERLSNSSRSSFNDSDRLEEELAELGIYDSELLGEDSSLESESGNNEDWQDLEAGQHDASGSSGLNGKITSKKKAKWKEAEDELRRGGNRSLAELVAPIILAHPLALLPIIPLLPYSFLPAGVVLFVPVFVAIAGLSACAHVVVVYLSRYLKVITFEDILQRATGRHGLMAGRAVQLTGVLLICSAWLRAAHEILLPVLQTIAPHSHFLQSRILWILVFSVLIWPSSFSFFRHSHVVAQLPEYLVILLPMVVFLTIGRTTEIVKAGGLMIVEPETSPDADQLTSLVETLATAVADVRKRSDSGDSTSTVNAGTAVTMITLLFTPHIRTLPIHSTLIKTSRQWFPGACLSASGILVILCLPFALVPYYLLAKEPSFNMPSLRGAGRLAGIFKVLQVGRIDMNGDPAIGEGFETDNWLNFARVCMITLILHSIVLWISQAKDISLRALGIKREGRAKAQRWLSACFWLVVTGIACFGGDFANRLEWLGAACILSVGWLLPAILFIKTFHLANPLSIVFPSEKNPYQVVPDSGLAMLDVNGPEDTPLQDRDTTVNLGGPDMMQDPSTDLLLARKERQLQKRRSGRRMWQDLIVFLGILPMGVFTVFWCVAATVDLVTA